MKAKTDLVNPNLVKLTRLIQKLMRLAVLGFETLDFRLNLLNIQKKKRSSKKLRRSTPKT